MAQDIGSGTRPGSIPTDNRGQPIFPAALNRYAGGRGGAELASLAKRYLDQSGYDPASINAPGAKFFGMSEGSAFPAFKPNTHNSAQMLARLKAGDVSGFTNGKAFYAEGGKAQFFLSQKTSAEQFLGIQLALKQSGLLTGDFYLGERADEKTQKAWESLLGMANRAGVNWNTMLGRLTKSSTANAAGSGQNPWGSGPRRVTSTSQNTSIRLTARADAQALLLNMWKEYYGREPAPGEIDNFHSVLNQEERKNPTVTTSTTTTDRLTGSSTTSSSTKEGASPQGQLLDQTRASAKGSMESQGYRVGQYTDVLMRMVGLDAGVSEDL